MKQSSGHQDILPSIIHPGGVLIIRCGRVNPEGHFFIQLIPAVIGDETVGEAALNLLLSIAAYIICNQNKLDLKRVAIFF